MKLIKNNWNLNEGPKKSPWGDDSNRDNYSNQKNPNNNNTKG